MKKVICLSTFSLLLLAGCASSTENKTSQDELYRSLAVTNDDVVNLQKQVTELQLKVREQDSQLKKMKDNNSTQSSSGSKNNGNGFAANANSNSADTGSQGSNGLDGNNVKVIPNKNDGLTVASSSNGDDSGTSSTNTLPASTRGGGLVSNSATPVMGSGSQPRAIDLRPGVGMPIAAASSNSEANSMPSSENNSNSSGNNYKGGLNGNTTPPVSQYNLKNKPVIVLDDATPVENVGKKSGGDDSSKDGQYTKGYNQFINGDYDGSIKTFTDFLAKYPNDDLADNAYYWIGEAYYTKKDYDNALERFQGLIKKYPDGNKVPDAMLKVAMLQRYNGDNAKAAATVKNLRKTYSDSSSASKSYNMFPDIK